MVRGHERAGKQIDPIGAHYLASRPFFHSIPDVFLIEFVVSKNEVTAKRRQVFF